MGLMVVFYTKAATWCEIQSDDMNKGAVGPEETGIFRLVQCITFTT